MQRVNASDFRIAESGTEDDVAMIARSRDRSACLGSGGLPVNIDGEGLAIEGRGDICSGVQWYVDGRGDRAARIRRAAV